MKKDTKLQALEKAQARQREIIADGGRAYVETGTHDECFVLSSTCGAPVEFYFEDPKPLEKDTYAFVSGVYRYATGKLNEFFPAGYCSKNYGSYCSHSGDGKVISETFYVIERPGDLESMPTPSDVCIDVGCANYVHRWRGGEIGEQCSQCTISLSEPSNFEAKK